MPQTTMPRLAAPVERTITGAAEQLTAGLDQSKNGLRWDFFAEEGDE
ncbi:hypothetical protein ACGFI3_26515 [Nonomuraea wenchangensis]